jgi:hypothetical protein
MILGNLCDQIVKFLDNDKLLLELWHTYGTQNRKGDCASRLFFNVYGGLGRN